MPFELLIARLTALFFELFERFRCRIFSKVFDCVTGRLWFWFLCFVDFFGGFPDTLAASWHGIIP